MKTTAIYAYSAGATGLKRLQTWALCGALALAGVLGAGQAAAANDTWEGSTPFATGLGNRVINALAASPDGLTVYAGTGSGTVLRYVYSDTTPDAFSFTAQTGAGLGTVATSNSITVAGINSAASISITGGEYQIGSASWTNSVGTLNIGDTVKVRITAAGSYSTVTQATLTIGSASAVFNVTTTTISSQSISFANPGTQTLGTTPTLTATATSSLTPTFTSATTGVCTITSGGALTLLSTGICTIYADQAGNGGYAAAAQVAQSFTVNQASQNITFGSAPVITFGGTGTVSATGGASGNAIVFGSATPAACTVSASTGVVSGLAAGTSNCTVTANQAGNANLSAAAQATLTLSIGRASQTIVFGIAPVVKTGMSGSVSATGGASGVAIVFASSTPGACTVDAASGLVTGVAAGTCTITANQAGNANYGAAAQASQSLLVAATSGKFDLTNGEKGQLLGTGQVTLGSGSSLSVVPGTSALNSVLTLPGAGSSVVLGVNGQDLNFSPSANGTALVLAQGLVNGQPQALPQLQSGSTRVTAPANAAALVVGGGTSSATVLSAGTGGAQMRASVSSAGVTTVVVTGGSVTIPCSAQAPCAPGQSSVTVMAGESLRIAADGTVQAVQLGNSEGNDAQSTGDALAPPQLPSGTTLNASLANLGGSPARLGGRTMADALSQTLQSAFASLGVATNNDLNNQGALTVRFGTGQLSAVALLPILIDSSLADGVTQLPNGTIRVVTNGIVVRMLPTLIDMVRFGNLLHGLTPPTQVRMGGDGRLIFGQNSGLFAGLPAFFSGTSGGATATSAQPTVSRGAQSPTTHHFAVTLDGLLTFVSVTADVQTTQVIAPTVYNFDQFAAALARLDPEATVVTQPDGKLALTLQGAHYVLTPDYQVQMAAAQHAGDDFWVDAGKLYIKFLYGFSQGFAIGVKTP